jgi:hypothetical protein
MIVLYKKKQYLGNFYKTFFFKNDFVFIGNANSTKEVITFRLKNKLFTKIVKNTVLRKLGFPVSSLFTGLTVIILFTSLNIRFLKLESILLLYVKYFNYFLSCSYLFKYTKFSDIFCIVNVLSSLYRIYMVLFNYLLKINILILNKLCRHLIN